MFRINDTVTLKNRKTPALGFCAYPPNEQPQEYGTGRVDNIFSCNGEIRVLVDWDAHSSRGEYLADELKLSCPGGTFLVIPVAYLATISKFPTFDKAISHAADMYAQTREPHYVLATYAICPEGTTQ